MMDLSIFLVFILVGAIFGFKSVPDKRITFDIFVHTIVGAQIGAGIAGVILLLVYLTLANFRQVL